jgi:hypothetical protein
MDADAAARHGASGRRRRRAMSLGPEERLHIAVAQYLGLALRPPSWWSTIHHGARVSVRERSMVKRKGARAGLPDIMVFHPHPRRRGATGGPGAEKQDGIAVARAA